MISKEQIEERLKQELRNLSEFCERMAEVRWRNYGLDDAQDQGTIVGWIDALSWVLEKDS